MPAQTVNAVRPDPGSSIPLRRTTDDAVGGDCPASHAAAVQSSQRRRQSSVMTHVTSCVVQVRTATDRAGPVARHGDDELVASVVF